jgi:membrane protease subunit (stomatin/prohibitin family)
MVIWWQRAVHHRQEKKWAAKDAEAEQQPAQSQPENYYEQQPAQAQPQMNQPSAQDEQFAQLEKLGELKEKGILTEAEFEAKKAQILGM